MLLCCMYISIRTYIYKLYTDIYPNIPNYKFFFSIMYVNVLYISGILISKVKKIIKENIYILVYFLYIVKADVAIKD